MPGTLASFVIVVLPLAAQSPLSLMDAVRLAQEDSLNRGCASWV
jgi:hypothetical protein